MSGKQNALLKPGKSELKNLREKADEFLKESKSPATRAAYRSDWGSFVEWCNAMELDYLPAEPQTIRLWITKQEELGRKVATIERSLVAISQAHKFFSIQSPTASPLVIETLKGIRRKIGTAQRKAKPLVWKDLKKVVDAIPHDFLGRRDSALFLLGWAAAMRRSEIVALNVEDLDFVPEGLVVTIRKSKTDQEAKGYKIGIPYGSDKKYCPTSAVKKWIDLSRIEKGPLFFVVGFKGKWFHVNMADKRERLAARAVNRIIKRHAKNAGFSPDPYSGHSLRAGFITSAAAAKIPEYQIQLHTRHQSVETLRGYIRDGSLFNENSLSLLI